MKLSHFIIVKLTALLILGICLGYFLNISLLWSTIICCTLLSILFIIYVLNRSVFKAPKLFGIVTFLLTISIGVFSVNVHNQKLQKSHYTKIRNPISLVTFKVEDVLKPNTYYDKYKIQVLKINNEFVSGTSLLSIQKDSLTTTLQVDAVYTTPEDFKAIPPPLNPGQFNYKAYLARQYIYSQITTSQDKLLQIQTTKATLKGIAHRINSYVNSKLKTHPFESDQLAVINALLLGQRQNISEPLYTNYTKAGAVHILAVSGLHVGIILLLLNYLLSPLERIKHGKLLKTICIVILMWCFAILTGLSPSVSRATLMFTLVTISLNSNRPSNTFNTVAISAFILLLWKPMLLFDVGFQLSYLAVFSIVLIQPKLNLIWFPKYKLVRFFWNILTVTFAAQIGVLPLSIYYFHQIPGLFFLSNLIIIPFLGVILGFGILVIILSSLQVLPTFLAVFYNKIIGVMNAIVNWIADQDQFIFSAISIELNTLIFIYVLLISLMYLFFNPKFKSIVIVLLVCIGLQTILIYNKHAVSASEWVLFHKNRESLLSHNIQNHLKIYSNSDTTTDFNTYPLKDYITTKASQTFSREPMRNVYRVKGKNMLIVDSSGIYNIRTFKPHYVVLSHSPKINLNRLIDSLNPKEIIADGSNYKSYISRWQATCKSKKIPFYQTGKKGAYIFK